ncbi:MAG: aminotransferase class III-fold pyridoxal phosphate-dependent enzyme [Planctomycetota bacterium]|nr:aminotransferase class III-fold pyridoxal phosphate-dependent enzyme [Planctomycetota bacterium]
MPENGPNLEQSIRLFKQAGEVLGGLVGHDLRYLLPAPIYTSHGRGCRKWDVDGNEYIDFLMGNAALILGHADEEVVTAIQAAAARGTHYGNDHPQHLQWAELVQQMVPSAERVRFTNSGTESTLLAIRLARAFTKRSRLLRLEGHYHGWHDDVVHGFDMPFQDPTCQGASPNDQRQVTCLSDGDLNQIEAVLNQQQTAAIIVEATGPSWGRAPLEPGFLTAIRDITERTGTVFILDEVISGFRFHAAGIQGIEGFLPDLSTYAKVLAGGMPGGAVAGRADIMKLMDKTGDSQHDRNQRVIHFGTFNAAPLSAAAGIVTLRRIQAGGVTETINDMGATIRASLQSALDSLGVAGHVYGEASMFHVYFETDPRRLTDISRQQDVWTRDPKRLKGMPGNLIARYQQLLRFNGVDLMSGTGGTLSTSHTQEDLDAATDAFRQTVTTLLDERLVHEI